MDRLLKSNFTWLTKSPHSKNMQTLVIFKSAEFSPAAAIGDLTCNTQSSLRDESTADGSVIESRITHQNVK